MPSQFNGNKFFPQLMKGSFHFFQLLRLGAV